MKCQLVLQQWCLARAVQYSTFWYRVCTAIGCPEVGIKLNSNPQLHRDLLLLGKIAERDQSAFCELFEERGPAILGVLCRLLVRSDAEIVLEDVFRTVWEEADSFHPNGTSPFGWMLQLARSRATERLHALRASGKEVAPGLIPEQVLQRNPV